MFNVQIYFKSLALKTVDLTASTLQFHSYTVILFLLDCYMPINSIFTMQGNICFEIIYFEMISLIIFNIKDNDKLYRYAGNSYIEMKLCIKDCKLVLIMAKDNFFLSIKDFYFSYLWEYLNKNCSLWTSFSAKVNYIILLG